MDIKLPFLKNKQTPRIAQEPMEEKLVNASPEDLISDHCMTELMNAWESKDHSKFKKALEAVVLELVNKDQSDEM